MHVGMIFLVLEKLLSFLSRRKYGKYLQSVLIIVFIWLYALITGLSPAVMRAAAMLSLLIAGKTMKRNPDVLNILAASALFLLVWQPFLLVDLGFQLSYLAVAGIVLLYKPVYDVFVTSNWLLDKIWSIMAVSIAAQLATLPVCLYYFHQFPNYFLLTNIVVIPLSNLIIYTGILALATGYIPWLSIVIARMLSFLVWFLNTFIHRMGALPFSVSRGIVLTIPESLMMYGILITLGLFISGKKKIWLFAAFIPAILLSGSFLVDHYHQYSRKEFVVYDVKKSGLYDFTAGGKSILAGDLSVVKDPFFADILKKSRWISRTKGLFDFQYPDHDLSTKPFAHDGIFYKRGRFLQFYNKRIMIIDHPLPKGVRQRIKVSYLVISGNPRVKLKELLRHIRTDEIIFDPSNSLSKIKSWTKEAHGLGVRCFSVTESGAFNVVF
jgi:competence protein ComEC